MSDKRTLGQYIRQQIEQHPRVGVFGEMTGAALEPTLNQLGSAIERNFGNALKKSNVILADVNRQHALESLGQTLGTILAEKVVVPQLSNMRNPKDLEVKLDQISTALLSLTNKDVEDFSQSSIDTVVTELQAARAVAATPTTPAKKTTTTPHASATSSGRKNSTVARPASTSSGGKPSSSSNWGGKGSASRPSAPRRSFGGK